MRSGLLRAAVVAGAGLLGATTLLAGVAQAALVAQTITFTSTPPTNAAVGGSYTVTAVGGASLKPVTYSADSSSTGCTVVGSSVKFVHATTCIIDANQAGTSTYAAATTAKQSFAVAKGSQQITFTSTAPTSAVVGGTYTVTATGGASLKPVTYTADASSSACSVVGSAVTFTQGGQCVIDANEVGTSDYNAATQVSQSFSVAKIAQKITISLPPSSPAVGLSMTITATGGASGLPVVLSADASGTGCTVSGSTVKFVHATSCVLDANQAGNAQYAAAAQAQATLSVAKGTQVITFTSTAPVGAKVGGKYTVTAVGGASLKPVTYAADSTSVGCTVSGSAVSFVKAGSCVIDANQAGTTDYNAASQAQQSFVIS